MFLQEWQAKNGQQRACSPVVCKQAERQTGLSLPAKRCENQCNRTRCIYIYLVMGQTLLPERSCLCRSLGLEARWRAGQVSPGQPGEMLAMDSTTLTRTLAIMIRKGWIDERRGRGRRERWLSLARMEEIKLLRAVLVGEKLQSPVRRKLGRTAFQSLWQLTHQVTDLVKAQGGSL